MTGTSPYRTAQLSPVSRTPASFVFADTVMYLSVNHEVAPKEEAYGLRQVIAATATSATKIDWTELGWTGDPVVDGDTTRQHPDKYCPQENINASRRPLGAPFFIPEAGR